MQKKLFYCFEGIFIVIMSMVFTVAVTGTKRHVIWYKELFVTCVMLVIMWIAYRFLARMESFLTKYEKQILCIFVIVWSVALYLFCYLFHNEPAHDYATICHAVESCVSGQAVEWSYFARYKNNFLLFAILLGLTKLALMIGMTEPFMLWLLFSVTLAVWSGICIYCLVKMAGYKVSCRFMALFLFAGFVPLWGGTYNLYTDCISLCIGIWACYLLAAGKGKRHPYFYWMAAGLVWGIGYAIKATVAVSLVAVLIIAFLSENFKNSIKLVAFLTAGFLIAQGCVEAAWMQFPSSDMEEEYGVPFSYWFALGVCGDGSYPANADFVARCLEENNTEGKNRIAVEYIRDNVEELWNPNHLIQKARYNFASGSMGLPDFNRHQINIMYEFFNDYGVYGGYTIMYTSGYFYAILLLGIFDSVLSLVRGTSGRDTLGTLSRMTVLGLVIFVMLFEANNRQLYNHMPWFALMGAMGCEDLRNSFGKLFCKMNRKSQ